MTHGKWRFQRIKDDGVLTQTFPDGTWRSTSMPLDEWDKLADEIQSAMRDRARKVVSMKRPGGVA